MMWTENQLVIEVQSVAFNLFLNIFWEQRIIR